MEIVFTPYSVKRYCQKISDSVKGTNPSNTVIIYDSLRNLSLCFVPSDIETMDIETEKSLKDIGAYIPEIRKLVVEGKYNTLVISKIYSDNPTEKGRFVRSRFVYPISRKNFIEGIFGVRLTDREALEEDKVGEGEEKMVEREISLYISKAEYENARVPLREMEVKGLDREHVYRISSMRYSILVDSSFENVAPDTAKVRLVHRKDAELETPVAYIDGSQTRRVPIYAVEGHSPTNIEESVSSSHLKKYLQEDNVEAIKQLYSTVNHYLLIRLAIREKALKCLLYLIRNGTKDERLDAVVFLYLLEIIYNDMNADIKNLLFKNINVERDVLDSSTKKFIRRITASVEGNENWNPENNENGIDETIFEDDVIERVAPIERRIPDKDFQKIRKQIRKDYRTFLKRDRFINPTPQSPHSVYRRAMNRVMRDEELSVDEKNALREKIVKKYDDKRSKQDFLSAQPREVLENVASFVGTSGTIRSVSTQLSRHRDIFQQPHISYRAYDEEGRLVNPSSLSDSIRRELRYVPVDNEGRYTPRNETALISRNVFYPNLQEWMDEKTSLFYETEKDAEEAVKEMRYIDFSKSPLQNDTLTIKSDSFYFIEELFLLRNSGKLPVIKRIQIGGVYGLNRERIRRLITNPEFIRWVPFGKIQQNVLEQLIILEADNINLIDIVNLCLNTFPIQELRSSHIINDVIEHINDVRILRILLDNGFAPNNVWNSFNYRLNNEQYTLVSSSDVDIARELLQRNIIPEDETDGISGKVVIALRRAGISDTDLDRYIENSVRYIISRNTPTENQRIENFYVKVSRIVNFMNQMYIGGVLGLYLFFADFSIETVREALYQFNIDRLLASLIPEDSNYSLNFLYHSKPENAKTVLIVILGRLNRERNVEGESQTVRRIIEFLVEVRNEARSRHQVWIIDTINDALSPAELSPRSTSYLEGVGKPRFIHSPLIDERPLHTIGRSSPELKMPEEKDMREYRGDIPLVEVERDYLLSPLPPPYERSPVLPYAGAEYREDDYDPNVILEQRRRMMEERELRDENIDE